MNVPVVVQSSDAGLRRALGSRLRSWGGLDVIDEVVPEIRAVIVVPASDCSYAMAASLDEAGHRVVVLAPVQRERERAMYMAAGASAYLPMDFDLPALAGAVIAAAETFGAPESEDAEAAFINRKLRVNQIL